MRELREFTRLTVEILNGQHRGQSVTVEPGYALRVGRRKTCDLCVSDHAISREHFGFSWEGRWVLRDLRSRNGTFVGKSSIHAKVVKDGDVVRAGDTEFRLELTEHFEEYCPPPQFDDVRPAASEDEDSTRETIDAQSQMQREVGRKPRNHDMV